MPKGGCIFIPKLEQGAVVDLPLGEADDDVVTGGSFSLASAQGQLRARDIVLTPAMHKSPRDARRDIKIGMQKQDVVKYLGDLVPFSLENWPFPMKPSFASLPEDTEYYRWRDGLPGLVIGFSQGEVVRVELLDRQPIAALARQAKPGMSKEVIFESFARQDWPATKTTLDDLPESVRPKFNDLPDDMEFFVWGDEGLYPTLLIGFSEGKAAKIKLLTPPKAPAKAPTKKPPVRKPPVPAAIKRKR
jgi:hypothetical protein